MGVEGQILGALGIFALRILGVSISTVRMLITVRGRRLLSSVLGFFEALIFAVALGSVVSQLNNLWNLTAYCLGFAVGTYIGMLLEERFVTNFATVNVVSAHHAHQIAEQVRKAGFGATETLAQGVSGVVGSVRIVIRHRDIQRVIDCVNEIDPKAFITLDETRAVHHGYLPDGRSRI